MIKPNKLQKGDTIALLSMSWGGPSVFPHTYEAGKTFLENELELKTKEYWSTHASAEELAKYPEKRAQDIMSVFLDEEIKGIIATIGGDDFVLVLPYLDFESIKQHPKIVMGYSDTAGFLQALLQKNLVCFHGPCVMAGFAQGIHQPEFWKQHVAQMLFGEIEEGYVFPSFSQYSDGYKDWNNPENATEFAKMTTTDGWHWLNGKSSVNGMLVGGCIEVMEFLKGTKYWPHSWKDKILILENSEDKPSINQVKWMLRNYGLQGVFQETSGLLIGRARDYTSEEKEELDQIIKHVCLDEFKAQDLTIVTNMDFGHTDPQFILPLGCRVELNPETRQMILKEYPFSV